MAKRERVSETLVGFFVILCATAFLTFALKVTNTKTISTYPLKARFDNVDGILVGSDIKISGIKIGTVTGQYIDDLSYLAVLTLSIDKGIKIPRDSSAKVSTSGLIGDKFLDIQPGSDDKILEESEEIKYTQSTINIEDLISRFMFSEDDKGSKSNAKN